jgi:hypothetical protein
MEMQQTHCYATEVLRYYGNAIQCIRVGHATKETQYVTIHTKIIHIASLLIATDGH